jgi:hypothetical protein
LTAGIDEFLAHITVLEAAIGLEIDHNNKQCPKFPNGSSQGATVRVATRLSALLGEKALGEAFQEIFHIRSKYLHGRQMSGPISSTERLRARKLARRVTCALVKAVSQQSDLTCRNIFLKNLLATGQVLV